MKAAGGGAVGWFVPEMVLVGVCDRERYSVGVFDGVVWCEGDRERGGPAGGLSPMGVSLVAIVIC